MVGTLASLALQGNPLGEGPARDALTRRADVAVTAWLRDEDADAARERARGLAVAGAAGLEKLAELNGDAPSKPLLAQLAWAARADGGAAPASGRWAARADGRAALVSGRGEAAPASGRAAATERVVDPSRLWGFGTLFPRACDGCGIRLSIVPALLAAVRDDDGGVTDLSCRKCGNEYALPPWPVSRAWATAGDEAPSTTAGADAKRRAAAALVAEVVAERRANPRKRARDDDGADDDRGLDRLPGDALAAALLWRSVIAPPAGPSAAELEAARLTAACGLQRLARGSACRAAAGPASDAWRHLEAERRRRDAALKAVQGAARSRRVRRRISDALAHSAYIDEEIDAIDAAGELDLAAMLQGVDEDLAPEALPPRADGAWAPRNVSRGASSRSPRPPPRGYSPPPPCTADSVRSDVSAATTVGSAAPRRGRFPDIFSSGSNRSLPDEGDDDDARSASAPSVCDTARTLDTARSDATGRPRRTAKSRLDAISRKMKHPSRESDAPRRRRASARPPPGPQPVSQVARDRMNRARRPKALPAWAQAPPRDE